MSKIDEILKENKAKQEPYKVPDGYFEDFTARLNQKIDAIEAEKAASASEKKEKTVGQKIWFTLKPLISVAAAIMILYGATYLIVQPKVTEAEREAQMAYEEDSINAEMDMYYQYFVEEGDFSYDDLEEYLSYNY